MSQSSTASPSLKRRMSITSTSTFLPDGGVPITEPVLTQITRRRIADAARRLFTRDGYAATTLVGIAREAGVAVQTVYARSMARRPGS